MAALPKLSLESTAFLVGAGASISSGIASGQMFNRTFLPLLVPGELAEDGRTLPLRNPAPPGRHPARGTIRFEQLVDAVRRNADPDLLVIQYLETSWAPSGLHGWLAAAIARGAVVMTTNLDSLIELAWLRRSGSPLPQVVRREEFVDWEAGTPTLLKLHGTLRRSEYLSLGLAGQSRRWFSDLDQREVASFGVTLDRLGALASTREGFGAQFLLPPEVLAALESALAGRDLVVAGYSGSDDFDVMPSLRHLSGSCQRVVWIDHRGGGEPAVRRRGGFVLAAGPTERVLEELFDSAVPAGNGGAIDAAAAFGEFCAEWSRRVVLDEQRKFLITGEVLHAMGMLSHSLSIWESGIDNVSTRDPAAAARFCLYLGDAYVAERSWVFAEEVFEVAVMRSERARDLGLHARAVLGYARVLAAMASGFGREEARAHALGLLRQFFGMAGFDEGLADCEVKAAVVVSAVARTLGRDEPVMSYTDGVYTQRLALLRHYAKWPLLQENKVLRAEFLAELSLAEFDAGDARAADEHAHELASLCAMLHLPLLHATFVIECADLTGATAPAEAEALYRSAARKFERAGYPVGEAEARLGAAVMATLQGRAGADDELDTARFTFEDDGIRWNVEQIDRLREASRQLDEATQQAIRDRFFRIIRTHWREFLGKAGWHTPSSPGRRSP